MKSSPSAHSPSPEPWTESDEGYRPALQACVQLFMEHANPPSMDARSRGDLTRKAEAQYRAMVTTISTLRRDKDAAYRERDALVCALSKLFPSSLGRHPDAEPWDDDWRWIVFVQLPTGQASWHIHDSELAMFDHLRRDVPVKWDGHTTDQKYARLAQLPSVHEYHTLGGPDAGLPARVQCQLAGMRAEMLVEDDLSTALRAGGATP